MDNAGIDKKMGDFRHGHVVEWANSGRDRQTLLDLHQKFYPKIRTFIASKVASLDDAEDLTQDVFIELYKSDGQHNRAENIENYVIGIARNLIRQYYRKRAKSIRTIPIKEIGQIPAGRDRDQHSGPTSKIENQMLTEAIEEILEKLPPKARQALKLRFIDGLDSTTAANKAECTKQTFRDRIRFAVAAIRKEPNRFIRKIMEKNFRS